MLIILLLLLFFLGLTPSAAAEPLGQICGQFGNYSLDGTYRYNLGLLAKALSNNASSAADLFAKVSVGTEPDIAYGLARCSGDTNASACAECLATAFQDAQRLCPLSKYAAVFYGSCFLRFSSYAYDSRGTGPADGFIFLPNNTEPMLPGWDPGNVDAITTITDIIKLLLNETVTLTAPSPYATELAYGTVHMYVGGTFPPLYSQAQCIPNEDILQDNGCRDCLDNMSIKFMARYFTGQQGGRVLGVQCQFRYGTTNFYHAQPMRQIRWKGAAVPPPTPSVVPSQTHKVRLGKAVLVTVTLIPMMALLVCSISCFAWNKRHRKGKARFHDKANMNVHEEVLALGLEGRNSEFSFFDFSEVSNATSNFSDESKLGQGGFGPVYKGQFPDGSEVAVKRLASHSGQGLIEFQNEVRLIAKLQHTNLVRLLGCCIQGEEKILIYEYLPNRSLDFFIFDQARRALLDWNKRLAIIEGIAQGILYLHKHSRLRVIHRDLKASNILLDCDMNPKISDFGLAKIFGSNDTEGNTKRIAGTYGYMAPEYASEGIFSIKSDVFSFGVLIIEIVSGTRNSGFHQFGNFFNLLGYAWKLWKEERWLELIDASLPPEVHALEMMRCVKIALLCVQEKAVDRPTMSDVVAMLSNDTMTLPDPKHPAYFHVEVRSDQGSKVDAEPPSVNGVTVSVLNGR
ncbi:cysteine-rich receptor-like protein kinase 10 [Triticum aestivum]|nr:cysteine-rich receptor-like protein kinase 10 [Triticum aestivum]